MRQSIRDEVLQEAIETAAHLLEKQGEFFPFAVVVTRAGEIRHLQSAMGEVRPKSDAVIESIVKAVRNEKLPKKYRCVGIVSNVELHAAAEVPNSEAIRVHIEGDGLGAVICYVPYVIQKDEITLGEVMAEMAKGQIFLA